MCTLPKKFSSTLRHLYLSVFALAFFANTASAGPASAIYQFDVLAVTSAIYNPVLPSPLTPYSFLTMNWDVVYGTSQFKQSNLSHGGGWLAFVTETGGYRVNGLPPATTYNNTGTIYFGTYNLTDAGGTVYGFYDEYYCFCNPNASFRATTTSIINYRTWIANMYVF